MCEFTCGEGGINGKVHLLSAICVKLNETTGEYAVATKSVCMIMLHFFKIILALVFKTGIQRPSKDL